MSATPDERVARMREDLVRDLLARCGRDLDLIERAYPWCARCVRPELARALRSTST